VVFLENEVLYETNFEEELDCETMALDKARTLREGRDITVVGVSLALSMIESAVQRIGQDVEVINLVSLNPIDYESILRSVEKTRRLVIVDYSWPNYSVAHEISSVVYEKMYGRLDGKIICLTGKNTHVGYSATLERLFYPSEEDLVDAVARLCEN
jgi:pyruvate/2-oxoglutarate/acetoin dehydrogenase E1 component